MECMCMKFCAKVYFEFAEGCEVQCKSAVAPSGLVSFVRLRDVPLLFCTQEHQHRPCPTRQGGHGAFRHATLSGDLPVQERVSVPKPCAHGDASAILFFLETHGQVREYAADDFVTRQYISAMGVHAHARTNILTNKTDVQHSQGFKRCPFARFGQDLHLWQRRQRSGDFAAVDGTAAV